MAKSIKTQVGTKRVSSARAGATTDKRAPARRAQIAAERKPTRRAKKSAGTAAPIVIVKREGILPDPIATYTF